MKEKSPASFTFHKFVERGVTMDHHARGLKDICSTPVQHLLMDHHARGLKGVISEPQIVDGMDHHARGLKVFVDALKI